MKEHARNITSGSVLTVLGIALLQAIPHQVETLEADTLTPAFVPMTMAWIIVVLAAVLLVQGLWARSRGDGKPGQAISRADMLRGFAMMVCTVIIAVAYVLAIPWLGYLLASGLALGGFAYVYGHRSILQILLLMVLTPPAVFFFFRYTMLVLLPEGAFFN